MTKRINYELIEGGRRGRLLEDEVFTESITGYSVKFSDPDMRCALHPSGTLVVFSGSVWDFGSWAIDTPAMVIASLEHDAICNMTNARLLPWSARMKGDKNFWKRLGDNGATISRLWRTPGVMIYSQFVARWRDRV